MTPTTGAAARPAESDGSGSSPGRASSTALAPTAAAAAACAAGFAPARTITTLPRIFVWLSPRTAASVSWTGPAVVPEAGGLPESTAAWASVSPSALSSVRGAGSGPASAPTASASGRARGRADRAAAGLGRALVAGGRDHERAEARRALDGLRLGRVAEARVGRVDADQRHRDVIGGVLVAVGVDGVLEPGDDLVGRRRRSPTAPPAARSEAIRIGSTRSPAAATMPASAVPLVSLRFERRVGAGLGVAVAVDGVVAGVGVAVERLGVDARVEHGDRRRAVQARLLDGRVARQRHGLAGRRIRPADGPHLHAGRVQLAAGRCVRIVAANPFHTR